MAVRVRGILELLLGRRLKAAVSEVVSDSDLLQRFVATRDEAAFELLVWRHGAMVLGLCRRVVRDEQLAEDAFQAVFLILARKATTIRGGNVAGWLFRVARRVAARSARRRPIVQAARDVPAEPQPEFAYRAELTSILDAEVARLPERLRLAVVLCYLGDHTTEDAARELGCPRGTVLSRLATARKRLGERLARRGVTLPAVAIVVSEQMTGRLISQTVAVAQTPSHLPASTGPALLAESVVRAMATTKLAMVGGAVLLATGLTFGVGWVAAGTGSTEAAASTATQAGQPPAAPAKEAEQKDAKPEDKKATMRKQAEEIAKRIETLQTRLVQEAPEADNTVDISVLQSALFSVDRDVLIAENQVKTQMRSLERAVKEREVATTRALDERDVKALTANDIDVREASTRLTKAQDAVTSLKLKLAADHPILQAAVKEVSIAEKTLIEEREKARPAAERQLREQVEKSYSDHVANKKEQIEASEGRLEELLQTRKKLTVRIAETKRFEGKRQDIQDELKVLREIQIELLRQRTLAELGLQGLQTGPARTGSDFNSEAQIKELRREIEMLRGEIEKLRKKN